MISAGTRSDKAGGVWSNEAKPINVWKTLPLQIAAHKNGIPPTERLIGKTLKVV